jgi:hypothetical protein
MSFRVKTGCNIPNPNPSAKEKERIEKLRERNAYARAEVRLEEGAIVEAADLPPGVADQLLEVGAIEPLVIEAAVAETEPSRKKSK